MKKAKGLAKVILAGALAAGIGGCASSGGLKGFYGANYYGVETREGTKHENYRFEGILGNEKVKFYEVTGEEQYYLTQPEKVCTEEYFSPGMVNSANASGFFYEDCHMVYTDYKAAPQNYLQVIRPDGKKVVYIDNQGNDLKLDQVYIENAGKPLGTKDKDSFVNKGEKGTTYSVDKELEAPVVAEAQAQFDSYLEKILEQKKAQGLEAIRK